LPRLLAAKEGREEKGAKEEREEKGAKEEEGRKGGREGGRVEEVR